MGGSKRAISSLLAVLTAGAVATARAEPLRLDLETAAERPQEETETLGVTAHLSLSGLDELAFNDAMFGLTLGTYGAAYLFPQDSGRAAVVTLLGAGLGVGLPAALILNKSAPSSTLVSADIAGHLGFSHGLLLGLAADFDTRGLAGLTTALGAASVGAGLLLAPALNLTPTQGAALGTAHNWGLSSAFLLMAAFNARPASRATPFLVEMAVSDAAVAAMALALTRFDLDRSRIVWADLGGYLGLGLGAGLALLAAPNDGQILSGAMLAGGLGGLVSGFLLSAEAEPGRTRLPIGSSAVSLTGQGLKFAVPLPRLEPAFAAGGGATRVSGLSASVTAIEGRL